MDAPARGGPPRGSSGRLLDHEMISDRAAHRMRTVATALGAAAVILFILLALDDGVPQSQDMNSWEAPAQFVFLAYVVVGYLVALRWNGLGGAIMVTGAVGLGVLASVEYEPAASFIASLIFFVPGLLFLLSWQRTRSLLAIALVGVGIVALLALGGYASDRIYSYYWGPTHPQSAVAGLESDVIEWAWTGGTTARGATVKVKLRDGVSDPTLWVSTGQSLADAGPVAYRQVVQQVAEFDIDGLEPATTYYLGVSTPTHQTPESIGSFKTFPEGAASFTIAVASCARTASNGEVFDAIREHDPLIFLVTGDWHYENIGANDPPAFRAAYDGNLTRPAQSALFRSTSLGYVWDDHDYGGDNADATSASKPAARQVYDEWVPHYPLPAGSGGAIYQSFSIGRVRFIMTDTRSERSPASMPDGPGKTMLGAEQKAWLLNELRDAADPSALIVWVNSVPWIDAAGEGKDTWGGYATERAEIAQFIADNAINNLVMLSGDAHMIAIDDGSNSDYSSSGTAAFPILHAAALDKRGSVKGGPYSNGTFPGGGHFGLVSIDDDGGDSIGVTLSGRDYRDEELVRYDFSVQVPAATPAP